MPKETIDQKIDALARMTQRGFDDVRKEMATKADLRDVRADLEKFATKKELQDTEEHLLDAIRGIEVKKRDFEALTDVVQDLANRVSLLEKRG